MIDTDSTSRAHQTIVVVVAVALVIMGAVGALTATASGATLGIAPGADSISAGETTIISDMSDTGGASIRDGPSRVAPRPDPSPSAPATPTPEPATPTPEPATPTPEPEASSSTTEPAPETTLHLGPSRNRVRNGGTGEYDVVVDSADGGVGAAEMAIVIGDTDVATITEVTVLGPGEQEVDIAENGSRADINYTARDTYDSGGFTIIEVTVEGRSNGETGLRFGAVNGNDELRLFNEQGTAYNVTGTTGATVAVRSGTQSQSEPPVEEPEPELDAFQFDLVEGDVLLRFDPEEGDTYHGQDRFIKALHITENEQRGGGPGSAMDRTYQSNGCEVAHGRLSFQPDTGVSQVAVSVSDIGGCEGITLSYAGYELPDGTTGWDRDRAEEQKLKDSTTVTLHPGDEEVLTIDVMVDDEEQRTG
jgi:hypothetical protein